MPASTFIINIHGIGNTPKAYERGEERYWIDETQFKNVLDFVRKVQLECRFTFDDGNLSDYAIAAPALQDFRLHAIFFVLVGRLDQVGYLSKRQVRELCEQGFEIGSHGIDHVDWTKASNEVLRRELKDSKAMIEEIAGTTIRSAALPFGLYDRRVLHALKYCGYDDVFSSDGGPRLTTSWPIPRYSLQRDLDISALAARIDASAAFLSRVRNEARIRLKASLGRQRLRNITGRVCP